MSSPFEHIYRQADEALKRLRILTGQSSTVFQLDELFTRNRGLSAKLRALEENRQFWDGIPEDQIVDPAAIDELRKSMTILETEYTKDRERNSRLIVALLTGEL